MIDLSNLVCRLIVEPTPQPGSRNMAIDETLLESAADADQLALRIYRWNTATLSLGYFQKPDEVPPFAEERQLPVVKRLSGGGAILHHHEWTYSLSVPRTHPHANTPRDLYGALHQAVIDLLSPFRVNINFRGETLAGKNATFLCFSRGDEQDLVAFSQKVLGSAQRRRRGAVLQHGSLLMKVSEFAPEFAGLCDLFPDWLPPEDFGTQLGNRLAAQVAESIIPGELSPEEERRVNELEARKYQSLDWTS